MLAENRYKVDKAEEDARSSSNSNSSSRGSSANNSSSSSSRPGDTSLIQQITAFFHGLSSHLWPAPENRSHRCWRAGAWLEHAQLLVLVAEQLAAVRAV